jgi:hypothetical protein
MSGSRWAAQRRFSHADFFLGVAFLLLSVKGHSSGRTDRLRAHRTARKTQNTETVSIMAHRIKNLLKRTSRRQF